MSEKRGCIVLCLGTGDESVEPVSQDYSGRAGSMMLWVSTVDNLVRKKNR